ncbi:MAG: CerR family C-terminal domain-containing protein [Alphaproteobacteria bacterium]|nr:CerR family C-terminal domain-containing protein [Alphaproteobacteria bacterium]
MRNHRSPITHRNARGPREDGLTTRAQVLEAAGVVFAQQGFDRATAKEIAARAGTNAAAINYHFGGVDRLYEEVLVEAHYRLVNLQQLRALVSEDLAAEDKLRHLIGLIVGVLTGPAAQTWSVRVISREFLAPSPHVEVVRRKAFEPKKTLVFALIGELLKLPAEHPAVERCFLNIAAPGAMLLLADRSLLRRTLPSIDRDPESLVQHLVRFALGGIAAIAENERNPV